MRAFQVDGRTISAYLAVPEHGSGPGVVVLHAWWGLTEPFRRVCDRLAEAGFVALAPDLYHGKRTASVEEAEALSAALDRDVARWRGLARRRGGRSAAIRILGTNIGSSSRIALSMTPRLLALPGSVPLHSCTSGLSKRYDTWRYTDGHFVDDRPLEAVRRGDRHARKRPARLPQHALEWTALERPKRPGIRGVLVYHLSHPLLARLVSLGLPGGGFCSPGSLYLG